MSPTLEDLPPPRRPPRRVASRALFAALSSCCFAIAYGANVVLSIAIVAMVNHTAIAAGANRSGQEVHHHYASASEPQFCPPPPGHTKDKDGPFVWDEIVQGYIRGSYFYGYLVGQLPGAILAERHSASWVLFGATAVNVAGLLVTPVVATHAAWGALVAVRVIMGLGGAVTFPAMHVMISRWVPPDKRGLMGGVIYGGTSLGTIGATLVGGYVSASAAGWQWVFYSIGLLSLPWCPLWAYFVTDAPPGPSSVAARAAVTTNIPKKFPTKAVFSSGPFWAILIAHFCNNCGWYMYLTELPAFMEQVLHKNMKENAGLSAVPYAIMWVLSVLLGCGLDALRLRHIISVGTMRKVATAIACVVPCACLVGLSFVGCDADAGTVLITVAICASGGMFIGFLSNHIDLAPNFAGRLMAITNTIATVPGIVMPFVIGELTEGHETLERWSYAFYATAFLYGVVFFVFTFFSSGEEQPWNRTQEDEEYQQGRGGKVGARDRQEEEEYCYNSYIDSSLDPHQQEQRLLHNISVPG